MKLLVLGSEGFAGQALVRGAARRGAVVVGASHRPASFNYEHCLIDRDCPDFAAILGEIQPTAIVLAASTGSVGKAQSQPAIAFRDTFITLRSLLDSVRRHCRGARVVNMSSMAVYGNAARRPTPEDEPRTPLSRYGRLKATSEWLCRRSSRLHGLKTCSLRIGSLYGQGQRKQLFWDLANRLSKQPAELTLFGDGGETRDFLQVDDFADIVLDVLERAPFHGEAINVATGVSTTVRAAAELLAGRLGFTGQFRFLGESPPHDPRNVHADVSRMKSLVNCQPRSFEQGIEELAEWLASELLDSTSCGPTPAIPAESTTSSRSSPP